MASAPEPVANATGEPSSPARRAHKRGHGEGTITQLPNGTWRGQLMVGFKPDGKPDRRSITGKTRQDVQKALNELRRRQEQGTLGDRSAERQTVGAFFDRWLGATAATVRHSTHQRYEEMLRLHARPTLGRLPLAKLRPDDLQRLYAQKLAEGQAPASVRKLHTILHKALKDAMRWGELGRNVADAVDSPAVRRHELAPPTAAELARLLAAEPDLRWRTLWAVAVYSGARQGEILGLTWPDVDLDGGRLSIKRTLQAAHGGAPTFAEPKTARSRRTITLDPAATAALREHRQRQLEERMALGPDYAPYDLVFASAIGTPLMARNVIRAFKLALGRAGLPKSVRFHDLRHAHATLLLAADKHPKVVADRLGHSTVTLTLDTYSHAVAGLDADAATAIGQALSRAAR